MEDVVILCGLGQVGWRVLEYFQAASVPVVVIDTRAAATDPRLAGARLVTGDCRQEEVLIQAGVGRARGVLILTSDDLVNISTALMVRHLNPNVRVVVRLFNQNLVTRLGKALTNVIALSTSALTAPLIALTALTGDALGTFTLPDGRRQVAELTVGENSPLRDQLIGQIATQHRVLPLAHLPVGGQDRLLLDVDEEARLGPGDRLVICGEPRELEPLLADVDEDLLPHLLWAGSARRLGRVAWRMLAEVDVPVKICTAVLVSVVMLSTLVYHFGIMPEDRSWADALYRTISIIATGADMREQELTQAWHKVFTSLLRVVGAALIAAFTAIVTNYLLRARLGSALEVRRIPDSGHVIVCGLGNIGYRVVEELLGYDERIVVIEKSREGRFFATARRLGVAVIVGDATVTEVLRQAHAATARAVVAATSNELVNLEIALLARELNPHQRVVVRLSEPHLAKTLREEAKVRFALSVSALAAPAFLAAFFGDRVQSVFMVGGRMLTVVELVVQAADPFLDGQIVRVLAVDYGILPICLVSADGTVRPQPLRQRLGAGDQLTIITLMANLERLLRRDRVAVDWTVEVTSSTLAARAVVTELLRTRQGLTAEAAEKALGQLPVCVATKLTRGQAEDLLITLRHEGVQGRVLQGQGLV